jgi:hypothetical protein
MRKIVTGDQVAQLRNPDPLAFPVWRAPVYRTPGWIIAIAQLCRFLYWLARLIVRHPVVSLVLAVLGFTWSETSWLGVTLLVIWAVLVLVCWRVLWPVSFARRAAAPARSKWRAWRYRRRWASVMTISGLAPWYQARASRASGDLHRERARCAHVHHPVRDAFARREFPAPGVGSGPGSSWRAQHPLP